MNALRQITIALRAVSRVFPFGVSLNIGWHEEEYPTSCGYNKVTAKTLTRRPRIRKYTFVKRE